MEEEEYKKEVQGGGADTLQDFVAFSDGMFKPKAHLSYKQGPVSGTLEPDMKRRSQSVAVVHRRMGHRGAPSMLWLLRAVMRLSWDKMRDDYAENVPARYVDLVCPMHGLYVDTTGPVGGVR